MGRNLLILAFFFVICQLIEKTFRPLPPPSPKSIYTSFIYWRMYPLARLATRKCLAQRRKERKRENQ